MLFSLIKERWLIVNQFHYSMLLETYFILPLSKVSRIINTGGTSSSRWRIMDIGMVSIKLYLPNGTTYKFASECRFLFWLSSTIVTCPSLSKNTTLNLSEPFEVQLIITPFFKSSSVIFNLKKCPVCLSTVPLWF